MEIVYQNSENTDVKDGFVILEQEYIAGFEAKKFKEDIIEKLDKTVGALIIDMSKIKQISSTGLGMLVSAYVSLKRHAIQMRIVNVSKEIRALFTIIKIDSFVSIEEAI